MGVHRKRYRHLLWVLTLAVGSVLALGTGPVAAQCQPTNPPVNTIVQCTGHEPNGYDAAEQVGVEITVDSLALVERYIKGLTGSTLNIKADGTVTGTDASEASVQGKDQVEVNNSGTVNSAFGGTAVKLEGDNNYLRNDGEIHGLGDHSSGVYIEGENSKVENTGLIMVNGQAAAAIEITGGEITNDGFIYGGPVGGTGNATGIRITDIDTLLGTTIINRKTIFGQEYAIQSLGGAVNLVNADHIIGHISLAGSSDIVANHGFITGNIDLGDGHNQLLNSKLIDGTVTGGAGEDQVINEEDGYIKEVSLGGGSDELINSGSIGIVDTGGGGQNQVWNLSGADISILSLGDSDTNLVINEGTIWDEINGGTAVDQIENLGAIYGKINLGDNNDIVNNFGLIHNDIDMGAGEDILENQAGGLIEGDVAMGAGDDAAFNSGTIDGDIDTGAGDDIIFNSGTIDGHIDMGTGDDTLVNEAWGIIRRNIDMGIGNDTLINDAHGELYGDVDMGDGDDTVENHGIIIGVVRLGDGNAGNADLGLYTLHNTGTIDNGVVGGTGDDAIHNESVMGSAAVIRGGIQLIAGTNTVKNSGEIYGGVTGGTGDDYIVNSNAIHGNVDLGDAVEKNVLENFGTIDGSVIGGEARDEVYNTSSLTIDGDVNLGAGDDLLQNTGVITGEVRTGAGQDVVTNASSGDIRTGIVLESGSNTVTNEGTIREGITGNGDGDNIITNAAGGTIYGTLNMSSGSNTLDNSGLIEGHYLGGNFQDSVTNRSTGSIVGSIVFGDGQNTVENSGLITGSVTGGNNNDFFANYLDGYIGGHVELGDGSNALWNAGTIVGAVMGGQDEDYIENDGAIGDSVTVGHGTNVLINRGQIDGAYRGGADVDQVTNDADAIIGDDVHLGDGLNELWNYGTIDGGVTGGEHDDYVENHGAIGNSVTFGHGTNVLINSGVIGASVVGGDGVNTIINLGSIGGDVDLGNGTNQLVVGASGTIQGNVTSGSGNDDVTVLGKVFNTISTNSGHDSVLIGPQGLVTGDVLLGGGNDQLILQDWDGNHRITGVRDGGAGDEDRLILDGGAGTLLTGDFLNFENITVRNQGEWTISGSIPTSEGVVTSSHLPALWLLGDGNHVTYTAGSAITVDADGGTGVSISGTDNVLTMDGDVDVTGELAAGIRVEGIGNTVTNNSSESIVVSGIDSVGVTITGDSNKYSNVGTVRFTGLRSMGVRINAGSGNTVTNHGTGAIIGEGNDTIGVVLGGSDNTLTNIGAITVTGANSVGTLAVGADNTVVNDSSITASGNFSVGAILQGTGHLLDNRSLIGAAGNSARGVIVNGLVGDDNVITNTGTIRAELANSVGVQTTGDGVTRLTNYGVVEARQHTGIPGVYNYFHSIVGGDGSEIVTNYGTLRGTVNLGGGDDELMLMAGSQLEHGHILMGDGNDTLVYSTLADDIGPTYAISGGDGDDVLRLTDDGVAHLYEVVDFETLELKDAGTWVFHRSVAFDNHIVIDDGDAGHLKLMGVQFDTGGLTVGKAATLSGTGTITGDVTVKGVIRPGHSHGTLNIDGDYNQADDSTYELELATDGTSDLIHATGAATIGDDTTLEITAEYGYFDPTHRFRIIEADGGVTGEFDNVAWDINLLFLAPEANTEGDNVYVDLVHSGPSFASVAKTTNQKAIAEALDQAESLGEGADVINLVLPALDEDDARQAYGSLSGEIYTQHRAASLSSMRAFTRSAADTIDSLSDGQRIWAAAYGGSSDVRQQGDFPGAELRYKGFVAGWAPRSTGNWTLGLMAGMGDINVNMTDRASTGAAESRRFGVYAHFGNDGTGFTAQFASGSDTFNVERQLALLGHPHDDRLATGKYRSNSTAFTLEGSVTYATGKYDIKPTFGLGWYSLTRPAFTETGAGAANLSLMDDEYSVTQGTIGITISQTSDEGRLDVPELRLGFVANSGQFESAFAAAFPDAPGAPFTIKGASPGDSAFVIGATLRGGEGRVRYELAYDAEFWRSSTQQTVHGKVSFSF